MHNSMLNIVSTVFETGRDGLNVCVIGPHVCGGVSYGIRPLVACLPAWFRFAQCLRRYHDTRLFFPHIVNAGKYSTTFFVVLFSSLNTAYKSKGLPSTCKFIILGQQALFVS